MPGLLERLRNALSERYNVEREIGSGGMAHVFLAEDRKHHRQVAVKVLRPDIGSVVAADRFLREIAIAAKLSHPHVLPLHDSGEIEGLLYYVMPFIEGESLRDRLKREGKVPLQDALRITEEVADALAYAHGRGVVHRDIKPENIMLSAGHAVVADFGIARALSEAGGDKLTQTGIALGTVHYMSPEQALSDTVDGRSDVYSLGCVLYEMLSGHAPFTGPTARSVMSQLITDRAPTLTAERDGVPPDVSRVLDSALAKDPGDRFATAEHFAKSLAGVSAAVTAAKVTGHPQTGGHFSGRTIAAIGAAGVILIGALVWAATRSDAGPGASRPENRIAVLPFTVHGGPQLAYLSEGIVDLLSRNLEGVEDVSSIDPATIMSSMSRGASTHAVIDVPRGRSLVGRFGAGWFILGSVNSAGSRMRIHAALYSADGNTDPAARASVEGDTAKVLELVDRLAAQLLVNRKSGAAQRLNQTAALTTHSLPALKAFLNAEQKLRGRAMDSAISGYQRAIAEDSTFALAYYRLAVAAGWSEKHALSTDAAIKGLAVSGRLTERDRRLITAYAAYRRGSADDAEKQYRAVLEDFPDDLEAEFQLGDLLYQYNPLRGRPRLEARPMLDKVLALDPGFL